MFDSDGDGVKNRTGWISPDDGFLVFDRNGDGLINDGGELFGNNTLKYDGSGFCADGYMNVRQAPYEPGQNHYEAYCPQIH